MEKDKLIDILFAREEKLTAELSAMRANLERQTASMERMSEDLRLSREAADMAASDRTALQEKIEELLRQNEELLRQKEKLRNSNGLKAALARAEQAEKALADAKADSKKPSSASWQDATI